MFSKSSIKYIQSLQQKKFRDEYNVFVAEGPKVVTELLESGTFSCKAIYAIEEWLAINKNIARLFSDRIEIVKDFELEKIAHYSTANKVVAVFEKRLPHENIPVKNKITLVLDEIQDPGNLGTIIRTADWFGIEHIVCSGNTADLYNSKVIQSTMASAGKVNVVYKDIREWLAATAGIRKFAATLAGEPINRIGPVKEAIIIIGNESKGVSADILQLVDRQITIPKYGTAESLNAAVATAIILYALKS
jgi:TrmH family RNA methyltransferase